jgi:hypothetical protein
VHELLGEESVGVNLIAEGEYESEEDEEWWVGTVRMEGEETLEEIDELEPEREVRHGTSVFMRKDDSGLEASLNTSGKLTSPRIQTSQKKTDDGAQSPRSRALKRTRRRSAISQRS